MTPDERRELATAKSWAERAWQILDELLDEDELDRDREIKRLEYDFRGRARSDKHRKPARPTLGGAS